MSSRSAILVILAAFAAMLAAFNLGTARLISSGRVRRMVHRDTVVHGDGARLYAYLRSAWFDRDLDTANELRHYFDYPGSRETVPIITTRTGYAWNHTPVGCAALWAPFFLAGHATAVRMAASGTPVAADGYSFPYSLAVAAGTHVYCLLAVLLLYGVCRRWYSAFASFAAVLTVWLASFLPAYIFLYPSMSHALSFFSVCLFLWLWMKVREESGALFWGLAGLSAGLMALVRTQNIIFLIVPFADIIFSVAERPRPSLVLLATVCFGAAFFPQAYTWKVTYGSWLTIPQGAGFLHPGRPAVLQVLLSPRHGLFSWTPALLIGAAGLPGFVRRERSLGLSLCAVFFVQLYLNSIVDDWWAGTGFGARRFDNCLPVLGLGTAAIYDWLRGRRLGWVVCVLALGFIAWNGLFLCQYALNWVSHSEAIDMGRMARDQLRAARVIMAWMIRFIRTSPQSFPS